MRLQLLVKEAVTPDRNAEVGTTESLLKISNHGLLTGNSIVNLTQNTARLITVVDENTLSMNPVADQTQGNSIRLFQYVDRTRLLKSNSLSITRKAQNRDSTVFSLILSGDYLLSDGQEIKILKDETIIFAGVVTQAKRKIFKEEENSPISLSVKAEGFNALPGRRTVTAYAIDTNAGAVVESFVRINLSQDGISPGLIDPGATIIKYPMNDVLGAPVSGKRLLDDMAELSGFIWYIDLERKLNFVQEDQVLEAPYALTDASSFKDFRNVNAEETTVNYRNKQFVRGGTDQFGNMVLVSGENVDEIRLRQRKEGNSGVYGNLIEDENITRAVKRAAEEGTNESFLVIPEHGLNAGDMIVNVSKGLARSNVTVLDENSLNLYFPIEGQTQGDEIIWYPEANHIIQNKLKQYGKTNPGKIEFETGSAEFKPGMKLYVDLRILGEEAKGYYLIESVEIQNVNTETLKVKVYGTKRDDGDFSTQKSEGWTEYFNHLSKKSHGSATNAEETAVSKISFYHDGMYTEYGNQTTHAWSFLKDGEGRIVKITNETNNAVTDIIWNDEEKP
jgi:hypothetical protein